MPMPVGMCNSIVQHDNKGQRRASKRGRQGGKAMHNTSVCLMGGRLIRCAAQLVMCSCTFGLLGRKEMLGSGRPVGSG